MRDPGWLPNIRVAIFSVCDEHPAKSLHADTHHHELGFAPLFAAECAGES
jgi:hypothetical protein